MERPSAVSRPAHEAREVLVGVAQVRLQHQAGVVVVAELLLVEE